MICPKCQEQGLKSCVTINRSMRDFGSIHQFYDEDGQLHFHDPNKHTDTFWCSNGHSGTVTSNFPCLAKNCDFTSPEEVTIDKETPK